MVYPTVAVRTKHRVVARSVAVLFLGEFVEFERVFVVRLRLQFQQRLGGVFHERFIRFNAIIRESGFEATVDGVSVCPSPVVG